jgi:prepilin-type N-terminal cleavage/methylation domain-containing protein
MRPPGFSLIETLVAMALALLLVVGTAELLAFSLAAKRSGDAASELAQVLATTLERLKSVPFDGPELEPGSATENVAGAGGLRVFVVSWTIESAGDGMKAVRIRAHPRGRPRSAAALTLYLCRDLRFAP